MMKVLKYCILGAAVLLMVAIGLMSCRRSGKLQAIEVTPANAIIPIGVTQPFTATAIFSDGSSLNWTTASTWRSDDESIAIVSNVTGSNGFVTALTTSATNTSITNITATDTANNISGHVTLTVTTVPIIALAIDPVDAIISGGTTTQFTATGTFADGSQPMDFTLTVTWSSSNTGVATISNTVGSNGLATAVSAGTTIITATDPATHVFESTTLVVE